MVKTIVVHIDGGAQQESRLQAAALLANEHEAHLIGSAVTGTTWPSYALLAGPMGAGMIDADFQAMRDSAAARLEAFEETARALGVVSFESRLIEDDAYFALMLQSRYADLVVVSQDGDPDLPARLRGLPEHLALHGARPVLVVPENYRGRPLTRSMVVGWDGSVQAIRAIGAALPLLRRAASVRLALVNPDEISTVHGEEPGADMALYLSRHGVNVEVVVERTAGSEGEALISLARDAEAGLIVAGAYGHSRYREWALGGVTRDLLEWSPLPLLLAH
ncbi:universal stress protein [Massilia sp. 9096]|uniref:universal stress protein n=1 Tax=Massilia sp. 9096 TaxID=1500894 RepID=UPI0005669ABC|nr:universal stress protein [Massilia sp. 9096]